MILAQQYFCLQLDLVVLIGTRIEQFDLDRHCDIEHS